MSVIILLLLVSICIAGGFLIAFMWSVRDGQFDDDYSPSRRILFDDTKEQGSKSERSGDPAKCKAFVAGEQGITNNEV